MTELKAPDRTLGRLIGGILLGALIGVFSPYMLLIAPLVFLAPVLAARLYAFAGVWPVAVCCAVQIAVAYGTFGPALAAVMLLLMVLPLAATLWLLRPGGGSLADCLRVSVPVWMLCAALALAAAQWAVGMSLADYIASLFRSQLEALPNGMADMFLAVFYGNEAPVSLNFLTYNLGFLDPAERALSIASLTEALRNMLALQMTGWLLSAAALTAILCTAWPMRLLAREGTLEKKRWTPLSRWHLPGTLAVGAALGYVVAMVVSAVAPLSQAVSVCLAVMTLATLAFRVQAVASLERHLAAAKMRPGARAALIVLALVLSPFSELIVYYGMFSALFGPTHGVVTHYLARRRRERGDGDGFFDGTDSDDDSDSDGGSGGDD